MQQLIMSLGVQDPQHASQCERHLWQTAGEKGLRVMLAAADLHSSRQRNRELRLLTSASYHHRVPMFQ
mgnify:CR=1 FL=1